MRHLQSLVSFIVALLLLVGLVRPVTYASSGSWSPTGYMSTARTLHTATRRWFSN